MRNSSTLSIIFGVLLLICLPFYLAEVEYHEVEPEPEIETKKLIHNCHEEFYTQRSRTQVLTVCIEPDFHNYTGYVKEDVLQARVEAISDSLRKEARL